MARALKIQGQVTMGISTDWNEYSRPTLSLGQSSSQRGSALKCVQQQGLSFPRLSPIKACREYQGLETPGKRQVCFSASEPCGHNFSERGVLLRMQSGPLISGPLTHQQPIGLAGALACILRILVLEGLESQTFFLSFILLINPHIYFYK